MSLLAIAANVEPWQGMTAIAVLAGVVVYLFKWADTRVAGAEKKLADADVAHVKELATRDAREAQARLECATQLAAQAREFADALRQAHLDNRAHEDEQRREFTSIVSLVNEQTTRSAESLTEVLGKLHDRFSGKPH